MGLPCQVSGALKKPVTGSTARRSVGVTAAEFPQHPADRAPDAPSTATLPAITQTDGEHHDRSTDTPRQHPNPRAPSKPGAETSKDRPLHFDVGPLEIDIPRTLGYYGGISAAVAFGVLEPPIAVFVAVLPMIKMLGTRVAPPPLRFLAQVLQGAGKPVGSDGQGTIRLHDPDRARHDIDHITSGNAPSKNPR